MFSASGYKQKSSNPEDLYIRGRATGDSHGVYDDLKDVLVTDESRDDGSHRKVFMIEHSILGIHGKAFSAKGDSGSLVRDKEHAMAGMLFAGCAAHTKTTCLWTFCQP